MQTAPLCGCGAYLEKSSASPSVAVSDASRNGDAQPVLLGSYQISRALRNSVDRVLMRDQIRPTCDTGEHSSRLLNCTHIIASWHYSPHQMLVRMILPRHLEFHTFAFSLLFLSTFTYAQEDGNPFDCHISYGDQNYDLNSLAGERSVSRARESPPSVMVDTVIFNLCADLQPQERVDEVDQVGEIIVHCTHSCAKMTHS